MTTKGFDQLLVRIVGIMSHIGQRSYRVRDSMAPKSVRDALISSGQLASEAGLVAGNLGEISTRLTVGRYLINAKGTWLRQLVDEDLLIVSITGNSNDQHTNLALHADWHNQIYHLTSAKAVALLQPPRTTVAAQDGRMPDPHWLVDLRDPVNKIRWIDPREGVFDSEFVSDTGMMMIRGHGVLSWGLSLNQVIACVETVEWLYAIERAATHPLP